MNIIESHDLRFYRRICAPVVLLSGDVEYQLLNSDGFPWKTHPCPEFAQQYRQRLDAGGRTLLAQRDGEIVFSAWVETRLLRVDELRMDWVVPSASAVVYDCITMPEWRGQGIYSAALKQLSGMLAEEGIRYLWIYAEEKNTASRRGIEKADFEYRGNLAMRSIFGITHRKGSIVGVNA